MQTAQLEMPQIELKAEPAALSPGYRACIMRDGKVSFLSQQSYPTPDAAQRQAALVFAGSVRGYRF